MGAAQSSVVAPALLSAAVALALVAFAVLDGNPAVLIALPLVVLVLWAFFKAPMRVLGHGLLFLALLVDNPTERPGRNLYRSPLYLPGTFFYETLEKSAHLPGMKLSGIQTFVLVCFTLIGLRLAFGDKTDGTQRTGAAQPLLRAALIAVADLLLMYVYGLGRGGQGNYALLQMQTMLFLPLMTLFFAYCFKTERDARAVINTFLTIAFLRALECIYYWLTFMRHQGSDAGGQEGDGSYVTTHSDSILATVAVVICIVRIYQLPRARSFLMAAGIIPVVGLGIVANNRRIAFVAIALGLLFSYLASGRAYRRRIHQTLLVLMPVVVLYIGAGWNAHGGWAKPVQSLRSVIEQKDASSATRDIENYNLLQTLKAHPITGSGFGHMYNEVVKAYDISGIFQAYRYVPHNSILWFWSVGGVVGFSFFWTFISVGVYLAARTIRCSPSLHQRIIGMAAITAVCAYGAQAFGDMGLMSWMGSLIVSSAFGVIGSLSARNGAWGYQVSNAQLLEAGLLQVPEASAAAPAPAARAPTTTPPTIYGAPPPAASAEKGRA